MEVVTGVLSSDVVLYHIQGVMGNQGVLRRLSAWGHSDDRIGM